MGLGNVGASAGAAVIMHTASDWLMHRHWGVMDTPEHVPYVLLIDKNPVFKNRPPCVAVQKVPDDFDAHFRRILTEERMKVAEKILAETVDPIYKSIVRYRNRRDYGRRNP